MLQLYRIQKQRRIFMKNKLVLLLVILCVSLNVSPTFAASDTICSCIENWQRCIMGQYDIIADEHDSISVDRDTIYSMEVEIGELKKSKALSYLMISLYASVGDDVSVAVEMANIAKCDYKITNCEFIISSAERSIQTHETNINQCHYWINYYKGLISSHDAANCPFRDEFYN